MQYRTLGRTRLSVSCVSYGTNMLGRRPSPDRLGDEECTTEEYYIRMVRTALDQGVNLFDTANSYQNGRSEELLGKALSGRRGDVVIATKCGSVSRDFSSNGIGRETEESLRRLQTDCIDLLQLHNPPLDDLKTTDWSDAFDRLRQEAKIRFRGVSIGRPGDGIWLIERGLVDAIQVNFNIFRAEPREELLPLAAEKGVGVLTKVPLARGLLSGKYGSASRFPERDWHRQGFVGDPAEMLAKIDRLKGLAETAGMTPAQLALRWVLCHEGVSAAIPGAKRLEHITDNAAAGHAGPLPQPLYEQVEDIVRGRQ